VDPAMVDPWSVQVFSESSLTVISDGAIFDLERGVLPSSDVLLGIGLVPFDFIKSSKDNPTSLGPTDGKATTPASYYFGGYPDLAFGGRLTFLLDHQLAHNGGLQYYRLSLAKLDELNQPLDNGRVIKEPFTDMIWNPAPADGKGPRFEPKITSAAGNGMFSVRKPSERWYNPFTGAYFNTGLTDNGHNRLKVEFFNSPTQTSATTSYSRILYIDNTSSSVTLNYLRRGTAASPPAATDYQTPEGCGLISYGTKDDRIEIDLTAVHPAGGKYTLSFYRGPAYLFSVTGDLTTSATLQTVKERSPGVPLRIGHLTGNCDIANISIGLSAPAPRVINGYGWVNLSAYTSKSFTLAKPPLTHSDWSPPATLMPMMAMGNQPALLIAPTTKKK
jgi:hypothetical protein